MAGLKELAETVLKQIGKDLVNKAPKESLEDFVFPYWANMTHQYLVENNACWCNSKDAASCFLNQSREQQIQIGKNSVSFNFDAFVALVRQGKNQFVRAEKLGS